MDGVDKSLAEHLIDDYTNLRTVSWAATSDVEYLENKYDLDAHEFFKALGDADVYRNEQSSEAGKLHVPDHRDDMEAREKTKKMKTTSAKQVLTISAVDDGIREHNSHSLTDALNYPSKKNAIPETDIQQELSVTVFLSDALRGLYRGSIRFTRIP